MKLSHKLYDVMVLLVRVILPASAMLYFTLAHIWGLPGAENVIGSIAAVTTFLGVTLHISSSQYQGDGTLNVQQDPDTGKKLVSLELNGDPHDIDQQKQVTFKVAATPSK